MPGPWLAAEQQVQRMGEHGLPRACLAREDVQPLGEPELGPLDEQEVLDAQLFQHEMWCTTGRGRSRGLRALCEAL
jgi:hypothetical protein